MIIYIREINVTSSVQASEQEHYTQSKELSNYDQLPEITMHEGVLYRLPSLCDLHNTIRRNGQTFGI